MAETTGISWCDATVNWWWGCTKVSAACDSCYAESWSKRTGKDIWGHGKPRLQIKSAAATAFKLQRKAEREGWRLQVFSNSMSDFFDNEVPDVWRDEAMAVMALTPALDWLVLTKRPKVARTYMTNGQVSAKRISNIARGTLIRWPLPNVMLGVTAETQEMADLRIPELQQIPAAKRFVSIEPMLSHVWLDWAWLQHEYPDALPGLDWVIVGGESGPRARPMHPNWARSIREQCAAARVPFHFKQWGEFSECGPISAPQRAVCLDGRSCEPTREALLALDRESRISEQQIMYRVGKARAGRLLDGETHDARPNASAQP